jgi:hypothetical protein
VRPSTFAIACLLGLSGAGAATAEPLRLAQYYGADVIPPFEVYTIVQSIDLRPLGRPHLRGRSYVLHAIDRRGEEVRVVVDAYAARVISVAPVHRWAGVDGDRPLPPNYDSRPLPDGPRAIESDPRYGPPLPPRYGAPQFLPDDDDDFADDPDEIDAEQERETGSLPPRERTRMQQAARTPPVIAAPATRSAMPARPPLPRPRPEQRESLVPQTPRETAQASSAESAAAAATDGKPAAASSLHETAAAPAKPGVRIIDMTKSKPRI